MFGLFKKDQEHDADVKSAGTVLTVKAGDNLLKSALAAGIAWPHDCRVGSCGTCRCHLLDGKIKPLADFSYVLTGEELSQGMILACQTSLKSDIVVDVVLDTEANTANVETIGGVVSSSTYLTHDIVQVGIELDEALGGTSDSGNAGAPYIAGQYAEVTVPGIEKPRSYSFATAPNGAARELVFFVRLVPGGEMTSWFFDADRSGTRVSISGPYGAFRLRGGDASIICVAGGSGMSAVKALLEDACAAGCDRDVVYLFGARTQKDLYCLAEMAELKGAWNDAAAFEFVPVLSEEPEDSDWTGLRGFVTEHITTQGFELAACQGYLCGPPPMIDAAISVLNKGGLSDDRIFFDKFHDASTLPGGRQ